MTRIAFFDLDGTLCNSQGDVLPSSIKAIRKFREEGNLAFICTGRSKPEIIDSILDVGFDGIIGAGGGYVTINDQVISHQKMPKSAVLEIITFFEANDIGYYLESNDGLFGSKNHVRKIQEEIRKIAEKNGDSFDKLNEKTEWFYKLLQTYEGINVDYGNVNKISFINNTLSFFDIYNKFGNDFHLYHSTVSLFGPESGEITVRGIDKEKAVTLVLETLGIRKEMSIAFGDGDNDLSMFKAVGYRIAMANGTINIKKAADEITNGADEDGIALSFKTKKWLN